MTQKKVTDYPSEVRDAIRERDKQWQKALLNWIPELENHTHDEPQDMIDYTFENYVELNRPAVFGQRRVGRW